jgi:hypothetical protein
MSLTMSRAEREEFLAGLHVGVLSVASPDGRGPLTAPVWYTYQPGGSVNVSTGRGTRKALAIEARAGSACAPRTSGHPISTSRSRARSSWKMPPTPNGPSWPAGTWDPRAATPTLRPTPEAPRS